MLVLQANNGGTSCMHIVQLRRKRCLYHKALASGPTPRPQVPTIVHGHPTSSRFSYASKLVIGYSVSPGWVGKHLHGDLEKHGQAIRGVCVFVCLCLCLYRCTSTCIHNYHNYMCTSFQ